MKIIISLGIDHRGNKFGPALDDEMFDDSTKLQKSKTAQMAYDASKCDRMRYE